MADGMSLRGAATSLPDPLSAGALDAVSASIAILDQSGTIIAVNEAWRRFAEENGARDPNHFVGWNYLAQCRRVSPCSADAATSTSAEQGLASLLSTEAEDFWQEYPCHGPSEKRWMRMRAHAFVGGGRRFAAVVHENITERVLAEQGRDQQFELLRAIFETALDAIVTTDECGTIQAANPAAGRMFGFEPGELLGQKLSVLVKKPGAARQRTAPAVDSQALPLPGSVQQELVGQHRDGSALPILLRCSEASVGGRRVFTNVLHDLTDQKAAQAERIERERRELVVRELGHRIKNIFATVGSVSRMLARSARDVPEYRDALSDRLCSLAATQTLLSQDGRDGIMLDELVAFELAAYVAEERVIDVLGDPLLLSAQAGQLLGMAIHELATNAAKYGALAAPRGRLTVRWAYAGKGAARRLDFVWIERGGPLVLPPSRRGFGTTLIERSLRTGLAADVSLDYAAEGVVCRICMPLDRVKAGPSSAGGWG